MARITAGITTSHVPLIGRAIDTAKMEDPYWEPLFKVMILLNNGSQSKNPMWLFWFIMITHWLLVLK
jgi:hypothetical protein